MKLGTKNGRGSPDNAPELVHDVVGIIGRVKEIRLLLKRCSKKARAAAVQAIALGEAINRANIRPFERYVKAGRAIHKNVAKARAVRRLDADNRDEQIRREVRAGMDRGLTKNHAMEKAAEKYHWSMSTIRRAVYPTKK